MNILQPFSSRKKEKLQESFLSLFQILSFFPLISFFFTTPKNTIRMKNKMRENFHSLVPLREKREGGSKQWRENRIEE